MKEIIVQRSNNESYNYEDYIIPNNSIIVAQYYTLEGYRLVTDSEKRKYDKPKCAMYWDSELSKTFRKVDATEWEKDTKYFVPYDYEFSKEITDEIARTRPEVLVWDNNEKYKVERTLIAVIEKEYPFVTVNKNNAIGSFKNCELIED